MLCICRYIYIYHIISNHIILYHIRICYSILSYIVLYCITYIHSCYHDMVRTTILYTEMATFSNLFNHYFTIISGDVNPPAKWESIWAPPSYHYLAVQNDAKRITSGPLRPCFAQRLFQDLSHFLHLHRLSRRKLKGGMALCRRYATQEWESKAAGIEPNHLDLVRIEGTSLCLQADSLYRFNLGPPKRASQNRFLGQTWGT